MGLQYNFVSNAPFLRSQFVSGSVTATVEQFSDTIDVNLISRLNQSGSNTPVIQIANTPTFTATIQVPDQLAELIKPNTEWAYYPHGSGSTAYGATYVIGNVTLNMSINATSNLSVTGIAKPTTWESRLN